MFVSAANQFRATTYVSAANQFRATTYVSTANYFRLTVINHNMKLQNNFLIYLAKTFGLILYWALVALFVWLFYDSYIAEDKWTDLFYSISFLS